MGIDVGHRALLTVPARHEVAFVLVGGVALQAHGFTGATRDVDIAIAVDEPNGARLDAALNELRAAPYLAGERGTAYRTTLGQLEVMRSTDAIGDHTAWMRHASAIELDDGLVVHVGSTSDLLAAKEAAGRDKDHTALPRIRAELLHAGTLGSADVRGPVASLASQAPPDPRVAELLRPRPDERRGRGLWEHGAELIAAYRERWELYGLSS